MGLALVRSGRRRVGAQVVGEGGEARARPSRAARSSDAAGDPDATPGSRGRGRAQAAHVNPVGKLAGCSCWAKSRPCVDNPSGAVEAIRQGLEHDQAAQGAPFSVNHYRRLLARSLLQLGRPAEARVPLEAIFAGDGLDGVDAEANWLLSRAYLQEGRIADAAAALDRAGSYRADNPLEPSRAPTSARLAARRAIATRPAPTRRAATPARFTTAANCSSCRSLTVPLPDPDDPKVTHAFARDSDRIKVETRAGDKVLQDDRRVRLRDPRQLRDHDRPRRRARSTVRFGCRRITRRRGSPGAGRPVTSPSQIRPTRSAASRSACATASSAVFTATSPAAAIFAILRPSRAPAPRPPIRDRLRALPRARARTTCGGRGRLRRSSDRQRRRQGRPRRSTSCAPIAMSWDRPA